MRLALLREPLGAQPHADLDKDRALFGGPGVAGRLAHGAEVLAGRPPGKGADRHRRVGRAEDRGAGFGNRLAGHLGHHGHAADIGGLALIGCHAKCGVTLQMLDGAVAFLMGQLHVLHGHVVLLVKPGAALAGDVVKRRDADGVVLGRWQVGRFGLDAQIAKRGGRRSGARCKRASGGEGAVRRARHGHALRQRGAGNKGGDVLVPHRQPALVAGQVDIRVPPARDAERIAGDHPRVAARKFDGDGMHSKAAIAVDDLRACQNLIPVGAGGFGQAAVDDGRDADAFGQEVRRRPMPVVVVGKDRHVLARHRRPAVRIAAQRGGEHDARPVVVAKRDGAFDGPGGQDAALGVDAPERLARLARRGFGEVIGHPFQRAVDAVVEGAKHRGARHQADVGQACQFRHGLRGPVAGRHVSDGEGFGVQPPAHDEILIGKDHIGPRPSRR